jgi:hypothetical protein
MTRTRLEFLVAAAFALALTTQGANAASLNPAAGALKESAAGSSLMQKTWLPLFLRVWPAEGFRLRTSVPPPLTQALRSGPLPGQRL